MTVLLEGFPSSERAITINEGRTTSIEMVLQLAEITDEIVNPTVWPIIFGGQDAAANLPRISSTSRTPEGS